MVRVNPTFCSVLGTTSNSCFYLLKDIKHFQVFNE